MMSLLGFGFSGWCLVSEHGGPVVNFTSFLELDVQNQGKVLSYPVEQGSFASYNKAEEAADLLVKLGSQGLPYKHEVIISTLKKFQREAVKLSVISPFNFWPSMTLESFSHSHKREAGATMLVVDLRLIEVREVVSQTTNVTITKPRNPTSAPTKNGGKVQPVTEAEAKAPGAEPNNAWLFDIAGGRLI